MRKMRLGFVLTEINPEVLGIAPVLLDCGGT